MNKKSLGLLLASCLGVPCLGLRLLLMQYGVDEKGLLIPNHPLSIALNLLLLAVLAGVPALVFTRGELSFPPHGRLTGLGCLVLAAGGVYGIFSGEISSRGVQLLLAAGILCMLLGAFRLLAGKRAGSLSYGGVSVYFAVLLIHHYRQWSGTPQLQLVLYGLGAGACGMLLTYQLAAGEAGVGSRKQRLVYLAWGAFFAFSAVAGSRIPWLWLSAGLWMLSCLALPEGKGTAQ